MGAILNQNVFKGVSVNGQIVKGLAKNGVVFWKAEEFHSHTIRILNRATAIGAIPDTDLVKFDLYVRSMVDFWVTYCDIFYRFRGTGDANFKRINLANPEGTLADFYGGYTLDISGFKGNNVNTYVDINFNPSLLVSGQKYQLNDASSFVLVAEQSTSVGVIAKCFQFVGYTTANSFWLSIQTSPTVLNNNRMNSTNVFSRIVSFQNLGFIGYSRITSTNVLQVAKNTQSNISSASLGLPSTINLGGHGGNSAYNNDAKISSAFFGKSISFALSQEVRTHENADMTNLGVTPIA